MSALPNLIYRFNEIPTKSPASYFMDIYKMILKFTGRGKRPRRANTILKKNKVGGLTLSDLRITIGTSLVAQWLRIRLPTQETQVWALVREDPTCRGATKPVRQDYWACTLEAASHNYWAHMPKSPCSTTREATAMRSPRTTMKSSPRSPQLEKARAQQQRPHTDKNKLIKNNNNK